MGIAHARRIVPDSYPGLDAACAHGLRLGEIHEQLVTLIRSLPAISANLTSALRRLDQGVAATRAAAITRLVANTPGSPTAGDIAQEIKGIVRIWSA